MKIPGQVSRGFSLVELVVVIVLLGILSLYAATKFTTRKSFSEFALRDQIITGARIAQQRAMYDHASDACYRLSISSNVIRAESFNGSGYDPVGPTKDWIDGIAIEDVSVADRDVYFDGLGGPHSTVDCTGSITNAPVNITITGGVGVRIYETGYIQALP